MRDDDHRDVGALHLLDGIHKDALARVIQAGVWLVENHKARITKKSPRKAETLAIPP